MTKKQSKIVAGVACALAGVVAIGAIGLVSKGFKNMDPEEWIDAEYRTLEIKDDLYAYSSDADVKADSLTWNTVLGMVHSPDIDTTAYSAAPLYTREDKLVKVGKTSLQMEISFDEIVSGQAGFVLYKSATNVVTEESVKYSDAVAFVLTYSEANETLTFGTYDMAGGTSLTALTVSNAYDLADLDIGKNLNNISLVVTKSYDDTNDKSVFKVKINDNLIETSASARQFEVADTVLALSEANAALFVKDCGATFKNVKYSV